MSDRDLRSIVISRQSLLVVTGLGVGLLTLSYVLGVQVGKQSAALRKVSPKGAGEELLEMPIPVADQLKALEQIGLQKAPVSKPVNEAKPSEAPKAAESKPPESKPSEPADEKAAEGTWAVQVISTKDSVEAKRMVARLQGAGFPAQVVQVGNLHKVRLQKTGTRESMDATADRLKARGYKPFVVKGE